MDRHLVVPHGERVDHQLEIDVLPRTQRDLLRQVVELWLGDDDLVLARIDPQQRVTSIGAGLRRLPGLVVCKKLDSGARYRLTAVVNDASADRRRGLRERAGGKPQNDCKDSQRILPEMNAEQARSRLP
jgi:hypothetical protein